MWVRCGGRVRASGIGFLGGAEGEPAFFGSVTVFGGVFGLGGGFGHFGCSFTDEFGALQVIAMELAEALMLVDFGVSFELTGAEVAAFFVEIGIRLCWSSLLGGFGFGFSVLWNDLLWGYIFGCLRLNAMQLSMSIAPELKMCRRRLILSEHEGDRVDQGMIPSSWLLLRLLQPSSSSP